MIWCPEKHLCCHQKSLCRATISSADLEGRPPLSSRDSLSPRILTDWISSWFGNSTVEDRGWTEQRRSLVLHCLLSWTSTTSGSSAEERASSEIPHFLFLSYSRDRDAGEFLQGLDIWETLFIQQPSDCSINQKNMHNSIELFSRLGTRCTLWRCATFGLFGLFFYQNHNYHLSIYSFKMSGALVVLSN